MPVFLPQNLSCFITFLIYDDKEGINKWLKKPSAAETMEICI